MNILSVYLGHNSTIAYLENNSLKYVLNEEKFDNVKNSDNFPIKAMQYLQTQTDLTKIDKVVVIGKAINRRMLRYIPNYTKSNKFPIISYQVNLYERILYVLMKYTPRLMNWINDLYIWIRKLLFSKKVYELISLGVGYPIGKEKVEFISHHESHALSVIYFYGLHLQTEPILVLTLDGGGDKHCATVRVRKENKLTTLATVRNWYSIGDIWSKAVTGGLGMTPLEHEYKVMGLAAYSTPKYYKETYEKLFNNTIKLNGLTWTSSIPGNKSHVYYHNKYRGQRFDNIAGALQAYTEDIVLKRIHNAIQQTGIKKIALSGGVFMNVKLNQKIQEQPWIEKVYFMPSAGDDSTPIGGVFGGYLKSGADLSLLSPVTSMYAGISYTDQEVHNELEQKVDKNKYDLQIFENESALIDKIATLLKEFQIVALFQGAGERGARSLCNRAILANAADLTSFHLVNDLVKMRDFWMPFAPAILEERSDKYIDNWANLASRVKESCYYMITAFGSTPLAQQHLRAAIHQKDKTLRPQLVNSSTNPFMYTLLKKYESLTGMGGVMNTSLNMHGYPLVGTIDQALFTLENTGLTYMVINNILLIKKGK